MGVTAFVDGLTFKRIKQETRPGKFWDAFLYKVLYCFVNGN